MERYNRTLVTACVFVTCMLLSIQNRKLTGLELTWIIGRNIPNKLKAFLSFMHIIKNVSQQTTPITQDDTTKEIARN